MAESLVHMLSLAIAFATTTPGIPLVISSTTASGSMLFSMGVGVMFGFQPANKAAKMEPIDALRYE
jgi:ABC-type antimicrobial peptide transport system permease subunit